MHSARGSRGAGDGSAPPRFDIGRHQAIEIRHLRPVRYAVLGKFPGRSCGGVDVSIPKQLPARAGDQVDVRPGQFQRSGLAVATFVDDCRAGLRPSDRAQLEQGHDDVSLVSAFGRLVNAPPGSLTCPHPRPNPARHCALIRTCGRGLSPSGDSALPGKEPRPATATLCRPNRRLMKRR